MANARGKTVDTTYLSIDQAEDRGFLHRDYIAHCLRWSHVVKRLYERKAWETARILDIGCGRELPMAKLLYSSKLIPASYTGVDVGPVNDEDFQKLKGEMAQRTTIFEETNFLDLQIDDFGPVVQTPEGEEIVLPNLVTCFEVLEHVEPRMMIDMLGRMRDVTTPDARLFISTPNWNEVDCAANHVNEMKYEALGAAFERHGFVVENVYGTFASIKDYQHLLDNVSGDKPHVWSNLFHQLREYYDTNFLSCIFAPLFPAQSRNCLWELRKREFFTPQPPKKFPAIEAIPQPWSSSTNWKEMAL